jgi:hypothetical protein
VRLAEEGLGTTTAHFDLAFQEGTPAHDEKGLIMRFGTWRGVSLAIALAATLYGSRVASAGDLFHHTIPSEVDAIDLNTGQPYYAPPIPYGHYAKGGGLGKAVGLVGGKLHSFGGLGLCGLCGGKGCGGCGGSGFGGHGCGDAGCGGFHGGKLGHGFTGCGSCSGKGCDVCTGILPSPQAPSKAPVVVASPQAVSSCGIKGCGLGHGHRHNFGGPIMGDPCNSCGGKGCGLCGGGFGRGLGCSACGGKGCGLCGLGGLGGGLGAAKGLLYSATHPHAGKIKWFVGPGGPVPLTPGYVPYVNPVRSPRDFFAFPPFTQ